MRLIDIEEVSLLKTVTDGHLSAKALWRRILRQPTVDAIPIEWIIKWECGFLNPNGEHRRVIKEMLHDWEKENEKLV